MIRRYFVWQHRWVGIVLALFVSILGITGALLAYRIPLERLINPQLFVNPPAGAKALDLASLAEAAERAEPHARTAYFAYDTPGFVMIAMGPRTDPSTGKPYKLDFEHVFLDPYTGRELGKRMDEDLSQGKINIVPLIYRLHTSLGFSEVGGKILGWLAVVWTVDCVVAFYLTLPTGLPNFLRRWRPAWLVKWGAGKGRLTFDLHRASGLWLWPMLAMFAWSGVMLENLDLYEKVTSKVFDYESDIDWAINFKGRPQEGPKLDWQAAQKRGQELTAALARKRGLKILHPFGMAYLPYYSVYSYDVTTDADFRTHGYGTGVWFDSDTGALVREWEVSGRHAGNTVSNWLWALHYGDVWESRSYRFLVFLCGLLIPVLSATGILVWLRRRAIRKRGASGPASP
jgi:uncharacterized iron-regulated membrane protein